MSWGFFSELILSVPNQEWDRIAQLSPMDIHLGNGCTGFGEEFLERSFVKPCEDIRFAEWIKKSYPGSRKINVDIHEGLVKIHVIELADKSTLESIQASVALFYAAAQMAKDATLTISNDGTYVGESGVKLAFSKGKVKIEKLSSKQMLKLADKLGEELFNTDESTQNIFDITQVEWHPQIANLSASNLNISYRASAGPQRIELRIQGNQKASWKSDYPARVETIIVLINAGVAGGTLFAPELGKAILLEGPKPPGYEAGPDYTWILEVAGVCPQWWAVALDSLADSWSVANNLALGQRFEMAPQYFPGLVSIRGELDPNNSHESATTAQVLEWIRNMQTYFKPWPEMPFEVKVTRGNPLAKIKVKMTEVTADIKQQLDVTFLYLASMLKVLPGTEPTWPPKLTSAKTQVTLKWDKDTFCCPSDLALGPVLNALRAFHVKTAPIQSVELTLP